MHDSFAELLEQPTARRYKQLRSRLLASGALGNFSLALAELEETLDQAASQTHIAELLVPGLLSLRLHRLAGQFALQQCDHPRAELHRFTYDAIASAILATGSGTRTRPLLVTYPSDSVELLAARGFQIKSQSLVEAAARRFDVILCSDEREFWFDVTDLLPQTALVVRADRRPKAGVAKSSRRRAVSRS
jgi:hypothetical protein